MHLSLILMLLLSLFLLIYCLFLIYLQFIPGAFYYPSTPKSITTMINLAHPKKGQTLIDLGSGDGRIVIAAARLGVNSIGYELNPILVFKSRLLIKKLGLSHLAKIKFQNFWKADFNQADIIVLYQFPKFVDRLYPILKKKLTHPIKVISNNYPFTKIKPKIIKDKIYLYHFL